MKCLYCKLSQLDFEPGNVSAGILQPFLSGLGCLARKRHGGASGTLRTAAERGEDRGASIRPVCPARAAEARHVRKDATNGPEFNVRCRQQHEEVIRRLDFQDEVLRGLTLNRRTSMGSKMSRPKTEGDESQSVPVSPVKPIQTDISPPRNGFSGEKVRTATGRAQMRRTFSVAGSPTHAKKGFEPRYGGHSCIWHMVHHPVFESFFAVVVVTNAVFIGIDVQRSVDHGDPRPTEFRVIQYLYAAIFTVELLLRLAADGLHFFCSEDWAWSWLDLFIVLSSLWEVVVDITGWYLATVSLCM